LESQAGSNSFALVGIQPNAADTNFNANQRVKCLIVPSTKLSCY